MLWNYFHGAFVIHVKQISKGDSLVIPTLVEKKKWNELIGVLGHNAAVQGYAGPGTTWEVGRKKKK